jgi:hypothetical protein
LKAVYLLIPGAYGQANAVSAVEWLQEHLSFSDHYSAQSRSIIGMEKRREDADTFALRKLKNHYTARASLLLLGDL